MSVFIVMSKEFGANYFETKFRNLSKECFTQLQAKLFSSCEVYTRAQIVTGFQNTGLFTTDISKNDQSKLQIANTFETPPSQPEPLSSQPPESMKEPPSLLAPSQPLLSESISTTSSISICRIASASKSALKSTRLETTFNSVITPVIQKEVEKQLQSAQSLAAALQ